MKTIADHKTPHVFMWNTLALFVMSAVYFPIFGYCTDLWGLERVFIAGTICMVVLSPIAFQMADHGNQFDSFCGLLIFGVGQGAVGAALPTWTIDQFPVTVRFSGIGIAYNLAQALIAGTGPFVASLLVKRYNTALAPGLYISMVALFSLLMQIKLAYFRGADGGTSARGGGTLGSLPTKDVAAEI
jgi:MHS family proline/betaine transporter-like MFS transporter